MSSRDHYRNTTNQWWRDGERGIRTSSYLRYLPSEILRDDDVLSHDLPQHEQQELLTAFATEILICILK